MSLRFWFKYRLSTYSTIIFFGSLGLFSVVVIAIIDSYDNEFSWHDIIVEAHGLVFDLLIFGILLSVFELIRNKNGKIEKYKAEIEDYIQIKNDESRVKIISNMGQLYDLGIRKFYLSGAYLKNASLDDFDLTNSVMILIDMQAGSFVRSNLTNVELRHSNLKQVYFTGTLLKGANLSRCDCKKSFFTASDFTSCDLSNSDLSGANFIGCNYSRANFKNVKLDKAIVDDVDWFEILEGQNVEGIKDLKLKYFVDKTTMRNSEGLLTYKIRKNKR